MNLIGLMASGVIDLSGVDLSGLTATVKEVVPLVMPVVVTFLGIRKGISFFTGLLRSA